MLFKFFVLISHFIFVFFLGYYFIMSLQWYSYRLERLVFNVAKPMWHIYFFLIPLFLYYVSGVYFWVFFYIIFVPIFYFWHKKLDKTLVFTARIKRFFLVLAFSLIFQDLLCLKFQCLNYGVIFPIAITFLLTSLYENFIAKFYEKEAKIKLANIANLQIIAITASFGKTSIKNFLYEILSSKFKVYKTPRSVNTKVGLIKDINTSLPENTEIYIAEAGARQKGDIQEIADLLEPNIVVVGQIGGAHLEYFKSLENIRNTKMELCNSKKLQKAFIHKDAKVKENDKFEIYADELENLKADLNGLSFDMRINGKIEHFESKLLGKFNATNLVVCIKVALFLKVDLEDIKQTISNLTNVEHRLSKIIANEKVIIDDSFNGNLQGMLDSYYLVSNYKGRKVIVTPGIVESNKEQNEILAKKINEVFDLVIITSRINENSIIPQLTKPEVIKFYDKTKMQEMLAKTTKRGDCILFSNDAPSFI